MPKEDASHILTRAVCSQLSDGFTQLGQMLASLEFDDNLSHEFRLFMDARSAGKYFKFPKKETFRGIKICPVSDFPQELCLVVRSNEYTE